MGTALDDVRRCPAGVGIHHAVIGFIRRGQSRKFVGVRLPVEFAAVDDHAAERAGVAVKVLGGGMGDDIRAEFDRAAVDRGREGVVHDQRNPMRMRDAGELLNVQHMQRRV